MTEIEQLKIELIKKLDSTGEEFTLTFAEKISQNQAYGEYSYTIQTFNKAKIDDIFYTQHKNIAYLSVVLNRGVKKKVFLGEVINIKLK
jgi:effector-binding domain-containing protein